MREGLERQDLQIAGTGEEKRGNEGQMRVKEEGRGTKKRSELTQLSRRATKETHAALVELCEV